MVSVSSIFIGTQELSEDVEIMWTSLGNDDYNITSSVGGTVDLGWSNSYEMIVGENDQLATSNIRYIISLTKTDAEDDWWKPVLYKETAEERSEVNIARSSYYNYRNLGFARLYLYVSDEDLNRGDEVYLALDFPRARRAAAPWQLPAVRGAALGDGGLFRHMSQGGRKRCVTFRTNPTTEI